jgi:[CysO sulfur-carrier protein]-S-L-cysteine hydrolase
MTGPTLPVLELTHAHWQEMRSHILRNFPEEACGFVAGLPLPGRAGWRSVSVLPVTNMLHSPVRYKLEPREHLAAFEKLDSRGWELAAIFHSHPAGPNHPSRTDLAESAYPDTIYLIWSHENDAWTCRAFSIREMAYQEVELMLI